jgi:hypothetical protein
VAPRAGDWIHRPGGRVVSSYRNLGPTGHESIPSSVYRPMGHVIKGPFHTASESAKEVSGSQLPPQLTH